MAINNEMVLTKAQGAAYQYQFNPQQMKHLTLFVAACMGLVTLISCGGSAANQPPTADGFASIEEELNNEFGDNAYYTELTITHNKSIGSIITTMVTDAPESLKMGQWTYSQGVWKQTSEVSLEIPENTKAEDFMFQLNDKINLETLGGLVEKSMGHLTEEKELENPSLQMAFVKFPKNGDLAQTEYNVFLQPEHGGTTFSYRYDLKGALIEMDY
ncbi:hypothetical protein B7P33_01770 [Sediminicola luteus]|uniref:Uncharacterized protein n=2 Tax=Sediminicola luteus TaxID=319238 RepID=A0A2A4GDJ2_9FLAO|nr:hypothetical protein B7P33_01770 [Sediminicola luteus]